MTSHIERAFKGFKGVGVWSFVKLTVSFGAGEKICFHSRVNFFVGNINTISEVPGHYYILSQVNWP